MAILSIHPGHNSTVGLLHDGRMIGLLSQEKLDNVKNSAGFPIDALTALLDECDLDFLDVRGERVLEQLQHGVLHLPRGVRSAAGSSVLMARRWR